MADIQIPDVVTPVVETESKLTAPLIDHEGRVTRVEERQSQYELALEQKIAELEERLNTASNSQAQVINDRITSLETQLAEARKPVEEVIPDTEDGVELEVPDVEVSPSPPEKERHGLRHRRKARKAKK